MESQDSLKLLPYSPDYPEKSTNYKNQILQLLVDFGVEIHHIGSTAVVELGGRGFIDILIGLPD